MKDEELNRRNSFTHGRGAEQRVERIERGVNWSQKISKKTDAKSSDHQEGLTGKEKKAKREHSKPSEGPATLSKWGRRGMKTTVECSRTPYFYEN